MHGSIFNHMSYICLGSVYYYTLIGSYWSRQSKILASDGAYDDQFGWSLSIYNNSAFIGTPCDDEKSGDVGMYVGILSCIY
jgi:hypothetical protein